MNVLAVIRTVLRKCVLALAVVTMLGIGVMMLTITYDVFARYLFAAPTDWAYPLNALGVLSVTALAVPYLYVERAHIAMDLLHRSMPPAARRAADAVTAVATGLLGVVIVVTAWQSMIIAIDTGLTGSGTFNIPFWIHDGVLVVSGVFLVLVAAVFPPTSDSDSGRADDARTAREQVKESEAV